MKLEYSKAKHDTSRCRILNTIIELEADDNIWPYYNKILNRIADQGLNKNKHNDALNSVYKKYLALSLGNYGYIYSTKADYDKAIDYYQQSLKLLNEIGNQEGIAITLNNIAGAYESKGLIVEALNFYLKSVDILKETNSKTLPAALNNIGLVYHEQGNDIEALKYYTESLKIRERLDDKRGIANSFNNIGKIYKSQGDNVKAMEYLLKCVEIQEKIGDKKDIATTLNNIGLMYKVTNQKKALEYCTKSLKIKEEISDKQGIEKCLFNIGLIYYYYKDTLKALNYFFQSNQIANEIQDKNGMALAYSNIADIYFGKGDLNKAKQFAEKSLVMANQLGMPENIKIAASILRKVYQRERNFENALKMSDLFIKMRDSLKNEETQKASIKRQFQYDYDKKTEADSIRVMEEKRVLSIQRKQERTERYTLYGGLALVLIFSGFMVNRYKVTQKQKRLIEVKEKETQEQKHLVEKKNEEITDSINYAQRIQHSLLASENVLKAHFLDYFVLFKPKDIVSGDFYWASKLMNGNFCLVTADSTGHGVPGAIMSILNISCLKESVKSDKLVEPSDILNNTRKIIIEHLANDGSAEGGKDGMDCSLISFNFLEKTAYYSAANNPIWLIRQSNLIEFTPDKMPVGKHDHDQISFNQKKIQLETGDLIYTFTDGLPDQFGGPKGKKFMYKRLKDTLIEISSLSLNEQKIRLENIYAEWRGELDQVDDICLIGIKI